VRPYFFREALAPWAPLLPSSFHLIRSLAPPPLRCSYGVPALACLHEALRPRTGRAPLPSALWWAVVSACVATALHCLAPALAAWRAAGASDVLLEHESVREVGGLAIVAAFCGVALATGGG
jgi:hypothetical protein